MSDQPTAPFGRRTIEGAFVTDMDHAGDRDDVVITVVADSGDEHEIEYASIDLDRNQIGSKEMYGESYPIKAVQYELTVPVGLAVLSGDDVVVDGFEATWTFTDVDVISANQNEVTVKTKKIVKSYGDTSEPNYEQFE